MFGRELTKQERERVTPPCFNISVTSQWDEVYILVTRPVPLRAQPAQAPTCLDWLQFQYLPPRTCHVASFHSCQFPDCTSLPLPPAFSTRPALEGSHPAPTALGWGSVGPGVAWLGLSLKGGKLGSGRNTSPAAAPPQLPAVQNSGWLPGCPGRNHF